MMDEFALHPVILHRYATVIDGMPSEPASCGWGTRNSRAAIRPFFEQLGERYPDSSGWRWT